MAFHDELRTEVEQDKYAGIMAESGAVRNGYLAALMNAPAITEEANQEPQGKIPHVPNSLSVILGFMDDAELEKVYNTRFNELMAMASATAADRVRSLSAFLDEDEKEFDLEWLVARGGQAIVRSKNVAAITDLILIMQAGGMLDAQTVGDLQAALTIDDPTWTPTIYSHGQSIAQANGWPYVQPSDVADALA